MERSLNFLSILIIWLISSYCLKLKETVKDIKDESSKDRTSSEQELQKSGYAFFARKVTSLLNFKIKRFHLKGSFRSQEINFFLDFLAMYKSNLIRKIRLFSKFMMSEPGQQKIAMSIFTNISRNKGNLAIRQ